MVQPLRADYTRTLNEMIAAGGYDKVDPRITAANFDVSQHGIVMVPMKLMVLPAGHRVLLEEVLHQIDVASQAPGTLADLLVVGELLPDTQRTRRILALASSWVDGRAEEWFPCLSGSPTLREVELVSFAHDAEVGREYSFLTVPAHR